jgi:hypothetical protein
VVRRCAAILFCLLCLSAAAFAQNALPVLPAGDAAVAGFSGTIVVGSPPEPQRIDKTYINLDGPALRVIGLDRLGGPPQGQFVAAAKPFMATARQIGQVFSVALDNADPPNIYAAATSAYGLPIVVPDADGDGVPDRTSRGAQNAAFMPGLFGPAINGGGPGSIWKIDGRTGAVSLFANVVLAGVPNSGPALGGLTFDPASRQIFVADRDTGMIHRFTLDGVDRGQFDHGVQGLAAAQLPPAAFDPRKRINLQDPAFDSTKPATWGYPPIVRRVFGLGVSQSRLYYAVASGLRVWSVAIMPDGSFGADARIEIAIPPGPQSGAEISAIAFDRAGHMLLAERDPPTGAYDYNVLATPAGGRSLRFSAKQPGENRTPFYWQADGDYALGFPPNFTNGNGGLALGYGYDSAGNIDRGSCGAWLWATGEQLRLSRDRSIAARLRAGGAEAVNGLQGNSSELVRPQNAPPFNSYFMSYIDPAEQPGLMGQVGGMAIWQICPRAELFLPPETLAGIVELCPRGYEDVRDQCVPTPCKPDERYRDGKCVHECPVLQRSLRGECCPQGTTFDGRRCVPPRGPDLTIVKKKFPRCATDCDYEIVITNNGPGTYSGDLTFGDVASLGQLSAANASGWICSTGTLPNGTSSETCHRPNTNLAPGQSAPPLIVHLTSGTTPGTLVNCAIVDPRGDSNPSNNVFCTPPEKRKPNTPQLTIEKTAPKSCELVTTGSAVGFVGGPFYLCKFIITVTNTGTTPASGATFTDTATPPARIVDFVPLNSNGQLDINSTVWQCNDPTSAPLTCKRQAGNDIPAGQSVQAVVATATLVSANTGTIGNCAAIGDTAVLNQGQPAATNLGPLPIINPNSQPGQDLSNLTQGRKTVDCATVQIVPPLPVTSCTTTRLPACSGGPVGERGANLCKSGECDCPLIDGRQFCGPSTCMKMTCTTSSPPPTPIPPPPPTIVSCPFPTFLVNGTCCTREAVTAGTCGTTTVSCPAGARMGLNGQCFVIDPGCQGPNCGQVATCPPAQVSVNGACCNIRDYNAGRCGGTQTSCPFPKIMAPNGQCICRGGTVGDDCHVPPQTGSQPTCQSPKTMLFGKCVCRPGTEGDDCHVPTKQTCQFPKLLRGGQCVCRGGTVGDDCHVPTNDKTKTKTCRQGTHLVDGECVRGLPNQQKNKSSGNKREKAGPGINNNPGFSGIGNRSTGSGKSGGSGGSKGKGN